MYKNEVAKFLEFVCFANVGPSYFVLRSEHREHNHVQCSCLCSFFLVLQVYLCTATTKVSLLHRKSFFLQIRSIVSISLDGCTFLLTFLTHLLQSFTYWFLFERNFCSCSDRKLKNIAQ